MLKIIWLWYFGLLVPTPAPDGWQTFGEGSFQLHLPPYWEKVEVGELPAAVAGAGFEPRFQFAPVPASRRIESGLVVGVVRIGKIRPRDRQALIRLQDELPREFVARLEAALPGATGRLAMTVYDEARLRLWFRIDVASKDRPPRIFVVVIYLTSSDPIYLQGFGEVDEDPPLPGEAEGEFFDMVGSFELDPSMKPNRPMGAFGANPLSTFRIGYEAGRDFGRRHIVLFVLFFLLPQLAVMLVYAVVSTESTFFRGRLKAAGVRELEHLASFGPDLDGPPAAAFRGRLRLFPLPFSLAGMTLLGGVVAWWMVPSFLHSPQSHRIAFGTCYLVTYAMWALALALHYLPGTSRRLKYELVAGSFACLAIPGTLADPFLQNMILAQDPLTIRATYLGNYWSAATYFLLSGLVVWLLLRPRTEKAANRAAKLYRFGYRMKLWAVGMAGVAFWLPIGGGLCWAFAILVAYYLVGEKARENPILYFRSFQDRSTAGVLAKIVMPTAGRFAPVVATTHQLLQPPAELLRGTNLFESVRATSLPNTEWQAWVLAALPRCRAVLIDWNEETDGLRWELEQAIALLPPERIAVLTQGAAAVPVPPGVFVLRYGLGGLRARWAARKALRRWLRMVPRIASNEQGRSPLLRSEALP